MPENKKIDPKRDYKKSDLEGPDEDEMDSVSRPQQPQSEDQAKPDKDDSDREDGEIDIDLEDQVTARQPRVEE
jgi:hypothetical protein